MSNLYMPNVSSGNDDDDDPLMDVYHALMNRRDELYKEIDAIEIKVLEVKEKMRAKRDSRGLQRDDA